MSSPHLLAGDEVRPADREVPAGVEEGVHRRGLDLGGRDAVGPRDPVEAGGHLPVRSRGGRWPDPVVGAVGPDVDQEGAHDGEGHGPGQGAGQRARHRGTTAPAGLRPLLGQHDGVRRAERQRQGRNRVEAGEADALEQRDELLQRDERRQVGRGRQEGEGAEDGQPRQAAQTQGTEEAADQQPGGQAGDDERDDLATRRRSTRGQGDRGGGQPDTERGRQQDGGEGAVAIPPGQEHHAEEGQGQADPAELEEEGEEAAPGESHGPRELAAAAEEDTQLPPHDRAAAVEQLALNQPGRREDERLPHAGERQQPVGDRPEADGDDGRRPGGEPAQADLVATRADAAGLDRHHAGAQDRQPDGVLSLHEDGEPGQQSCAGEVPGPRAPEPLAEAPHQPRRRRHDPDGGLGAGQGSVGEDQGLEGEQDAGDERGGEALPQRPGQHVGAAGAEHLEGEHADLHGHIGPERRRQRHQQEDRQRRRDRPDRCSGPDVGQPVRHLLVGADVVEGHAHVQRDAGAVEHQGAAGPRPGEGQDGEHEGEEGQHPPVPPRPVQDRQAPPDDERQVELADALGLPEVGSHPDGEIERHRRSVFQAPDCVPSTA